MSHFNEWFVEEVIQELENVKKLKEENEKLKLCLYYEGGPMMGEMSVNGLAECFDSIRNDTDFRSSLSRHFECCVFKGCVSYIVQTLDMFTCMENANQYFVSCWNNIGKVLDDRDYVHNDYVHNDYVQKEDEYLYIGVVIKIKDNSHKNMYFSVDEEDVVDFFENCLDLERNDYIISKVTIRDCAKMKIDVTNWTYEDYEHQGLRPIIPELIKYNNKDCVQ